MRNRFYRVETEMVIPHYFETNLYFRDYSFPGEDPLESYRYHLDPKLRNGSIFEVVEQQELPYFVEKHFDQLLNARHSTQYISVRNERLELYEVKIREIEGELFLKIEYTKPYKYPIYRLNNYHEVSDLGYSHYGLFDDFNNYLGYVPSFYEEFSFWKKFIDIKDVLVESPNSYLAAFYDSHKLVRCREDSRFSDFKYREYYDSLTNAENIERVVTRTIHNQLIYENDKVLAQFIESEEYVLGIVKYIDGIAVLAASERLMILLDHVNCLQVIF